MKSSATKSVKPIGVESAIQSMLKGNTKEGFADIVNISCANHKYLSEWKSTEWSLATFKGVVEVVRRYEVDELKYDGRSAWILFMMLEYGSQLRSWTFFENDRELVNTLIATLLRILIEHSNYNQIYLIFRTLMFSYGLNPGEIFSIGCALLEQLPANIKDDNFIILLDLAVISIERDVGCLAHAVKMLAYCSNFVVCNWKSNFFLDQKLATLSTVFQNYENGELSKQLFDILFDTVQLLRRLATMHEHNAKNIINNEQVIHCLRTFIAPESVTPPNVRREVLTIFNMLTRVPQGVNRIKEYLSVSQLRKLLGGGDDLLVAELVVDIFFTLYEAELEYCDDRFYYVLQMDSEYSNFIGDVLRHCLDTLQNDFPFRTDSAPSSPLNHSSISVHLDAIARICFRLERSIFILSEFRSFLPIKTSMLQICGRIIGDDFSQLSIKYHSAIDIICCILRGTHRCYLPPAIDPLDEDFIYTSSSLVEQFLSVTRKKLFDHKDANSLNYLAGADSESPIQSMIAKSSESHGRYQSANLRRMKNRESPTLPAHNSEASSESKPLDKSNATPKRQEQHAYLDTVEVLLKQFVRRISWLRRSVNYWELDSADVSARRVCFITLLVRLFGVDILEEIVPDFSSLRSVVFQLLVDPSLSLSSYLGIESKCLQLLSLLFLQHGSFDQNIQCYEYLKKIILTNPEMLSERWRSEYQREQVSMDSPSSNPFHGGGLLGFSPPRESLLYGSASGTAHHSAANILLETGNLVGIQLQLLYDAVNTLLVLSEVDRSVRRKLVATCASILSCLSYYVPVDAITLRPVLHLVTSIIEFASKFEVEAEEAIVTVVIRTLKSPLHYVRCQSCNLIYYIGTESPGLVFRGLSRREVEDPVMDIISDSPFEYPRLIVSAIKATATLVHNFNIKPAWIPSLILYHWRCYQPQLTTRPLLGITGLALVINLLRHAPVPFRLLYFTYTVSLSASLMYACSELTGNPKPDDMKVLQEMKGYLIDIVLPWLPLAIDFISLGKRKRRFDIMEIIPSTFTSSTAPHSTATVENPINSLTHHHQEGSNNARSTDKKKVDKKPLPLNIQAILREMYSCSSVARTDQHISSEEADCPICRDSHFDVWSFLQVKCNMDSYDDATAIIGDVSNLVTVILQMENERTTLSHAKREGEGEGDHSVVVTTASAPCEFPTFPQASLYRRHILHKHHPSTGLNHAADSVYRSKSMEFLTVKTIDALYAFLCMDDMYPLATYLRYTHLFDQCHVIASVSYFMSEQHENPLVLKRGLDLLRYFADHQMQLSVIAMHSPPALIAVMRLMQDSLEAQLSFAKIILAINRTDDDFARENLLRFRIHQVLLELMLRESHPELVRTCVQALLALAASEIHIREIARVELPASLAPSKPIASSGGSGGSNSSSSNSSSSSNNNGPGTLIGTGPLVTFDMNGSGSSMGTFSNPKSNMRRGSGLPAPGSSSSNSSSSNSSHVHHEKVTKQSPPSNAPSPSQTTSTPHELRNSTPETGNSRHDAEVIAADEATNNILLFPASQQNVPFAIIPKSSSSLSSSSPGVLLTKASSVPSITTAYGTAATGTAGSTINLIDVLLYVLETQTKELRTHYYALRLFVLVESLFKQGVHHVLRKSPLAGAIKKSKKLLKKTYVDDAPVPASGVDSHTTGASSQGGSGSSAHVHVQASLARHSSRNLSTDNSAASGKGEEVEKRDVEVLLNEPIIKNDRCVIS